MSETTDYTLTSSELASIRKLLEFQSKVGPGVETPSWDAVQTLMHYLGKLSSAYPAVVNTTFKSWFDQLFSAVIATKTSYSLTFPALYIAYDYLDFLQHRTQANYEWLQPWENYYSVRNWPEHTYPTNWNAAIESIRSNPPPKVFDEGGEGSGPYNYGIVVGFEKNVIAGWSDREQVLTEVAMVWQAQSNTAHAMLQPVSLTAGDYFFLLHLLIALCTSNAKDKEFAEKIVSTIANSQEYPNDTFLNQLVYVTLLYLADPQGSYALGNAQLQTALKDIDSMILGTDPASNAIKASLTKHLKVLQVDSAYPMQDPYSPSVGVTQRKTDTLFSLDKARETLRG